MAEEVVELYRQKKNFPTYRQEKLRQAAENTEGEFIKALMAKKKRILAELEAEIAEARLKIAQRGISISTTERKRSAELELQKEKKELDLKFAKEVKALHGQGLAVTVIAQMCGASSLGMFYQALHHTDPESIDLGYTPGRFDPDKHSWHYSDVTSTHRFALSTNRQVVRIHDTNDPENSVYILRSDRTVLAGDRDLARNYNPERVELLERLLDGHEDVHNYREVPNPYKGV